jgi:uncharacterized RDD family membrane protein YckC
MVAQQPQRLPAVDPARLRGVVWRRVVAYAIDVGVIGALMGLAFLVLSPLFVVSLGLLSAPIVFVVGLIPIAYHTLLIGGRRSATLGQRLLDLEVRSVEGHRPTLFQAFILTVLFYVSITLTSLLILAVVPLTRYRQGVHDLLAATLVLRRNMGPDTLPRDQRPQEQRP